MIHIRTKVRSIVCVQPIYQKGRHKQYWLVLRNIYWIKVSQIIFNLVSITKSLVPSLLWTDDYKLTSGCFLGYLCIGRFGVDRCLSDYGIVLRSSEDYVIRRLRYPKIFDSIIRRRYPKITLSDVIRRLRRLRFLGSTDHVWCARAHLYYDEMCSRLELYEAQVHFMR